MPGRHKAHAAIAGTGRASSSLTNTTEELRDGERAKHMGRGIQGRLEVERKAEVMRGKESMAQGRGEMRKTHAGADTVN